MLLVPGTTYTVQAVQILPYGAVMRFDDGTTQLLHISNIVDAYVDKVENHIMLGQYYEVNTIIGHVNPVEITLRPFSDYPEELYISDRTFVYMKTYSPEKKKKERHFKSHYTNGTYKTLRRNSYVTV